MEEKAEEILETIRKHQIEIRSFNVKRLGLFGSFGRGDAGGDSDLDFLVEFEKKSFDSYMDLKAFLERVFNRKVDLVTEEALKPRLRSSILEGVTYVQGL